MDPSYAITGGNTYSEAMNPVLTELRQQHYAKAAERAQALADGENAEAATEAHDLLDKINTYAQGKLDEARAAKENHDYAAYAAGLDAVSEGFRGMDVGTQATNEQREFTRDRDLQKELKAQKAFAAAKEVDDRGDWQNAYRG